MARGKQSLKLLLKYPEFEIFYGADNFVIREPNKQKETYCSDFTTLPIVLSRFLLGIKLDKRTQPFKDFKEFARFIRATIAPILGFCDEITNNLKVDRLKGSIV